MSAVTATVGSDSWLVDGGGGGEWGLAQLVADLCRDRGGVRTLISQLHLRGEELFNTGGHAATPPHLSAACLTELDRAGVSRGTAVVADERETLGVHPRHGYPYPVVAGSGGDQVRIEYGSAQLVREAGGRSPGSTRHVCRLGSLFVQAPTSRGNVVLLPVADGRTVEAAALAAAGRAETVDDEAELSAWMEVQRDPQWREHARWGRERSAAGGVVSRAVARLRDGSAARTVRLVDDDVPCRERYPGICARLEQVFAASARTGLPVRWEAAGRGA